MKDFGKEETEAYRGVCLRARFLRQNSSRSTSSSSNGIALPAVNRPLTELIRLPHSLPSTDDPFRHHSLYVRFHIASFCFKSASNTFSN